MSGKFETFTIQSVRKFNETACWISFDRPIDATPGQFVMAWLPEIGEKPFSIAAMSPFSLMVVDVGPFSHALHQLKAGDSVWIKGPLGQGYTIEGQSMVLVGGGYGSAPLYALAEAALQQDREVRVCLGARSGADLLLVDEFEALGCEVFPATEDGSVGLRGLVTLAVNEILDDHAVDTLYACGPVGMLSALAEVGKDRALVYQLSWEAQMRCGMGLCGSCEVPQTLDPALPVGWLACFDGPVFKHRPD
ncbi:dihydroorotate dehydrogenase electron transfer subunit [bacterium]|nr:dihydroorotate dehydrogenase electron transfer subunit [bacterium]